MKRFVLGAVAALAFAGSAHATSFGVSCIAGSTQACNVGQASLQVDVAGSGGSVTLTFSNSDPGTSALVAVYIEDAGLIKSASLGGGAGTSFKKGGKPNNLPGAGSSFVDDFRFTAKKKVAVNGVNGGETLSITLTLVSGKTVSDVLNAIAAGSLRFGLHISDADPNCLGNDPGPNCTGDPGSASFVNLKTAVPEPGATALAGVACLGLALIGRRR